MQLELKEIAGKNPIAVMRKSFVLDESLIDSYGNHLNHALALTLFESERARFLESHGIPYHQLAERFGVLFFVHHLQAVYPRQGFLGDHVEVVSNLYHRSASLLFHNLLQRGDENLVEALITLGAVDVKSGRAARIPKGLIDLFHA